MDIFSLIAVLMGIGVGYLVGEYVKRYHRKYYDHVAYGFMAISLLAATALIYYYTRS